MSSLIINTPDVFWSRVSKTESCWNWLAGKFHNGYGYFWTDGKLIRAHRLSYELVNGSLPEDRELHHTCENKGCVNPNHLIVISKEAHAALSDKAAENRHKTHCPKGHPLSGDNLVQYELKKFGHRVCKKCKSDLKKEIKRRKKEQA